MRVTILLAMAMALFSGCCSLSQVLQPNNVPSSCQPPAGDFSSDKTIIMEGEQITYTDQSTGVNIQSRKWILPGATPNGIEGETATATYPESGKFPVTLEVINPRGTDRVTKPEYVTVLKRLNADFSGLPRTVRVGQQVTFTDRSTGDNITSREWVIEGASPSAQAGTSARVTFQEPGKYRVTLVIKNSLGHRDDEVKTDYITVVGPTVETFQPGAITRQCPSHVDGDREFDGNGPDVTAWADLRIVDDTKIYVDYYLKARETRSDWTTAEERWSKLLWTAPAGHTIVRINSDTRSETSYRDNDHDLDRPSVRGGNLIKRFEIMGDTGGNDVGNCTNDDVYLNLHFNEVSVTIQDNPN